MINTHDNKPDTEPPAAPQNRHELTVEKWVYGGAGLGRIEGRVALAPFVLPGERVEIEVLRSKTSLAEGRVLRIVESAPQRVAPDCKYFEKCGGCDYQHAGYAFEVQQKVEIVREVMKRIGKLDLPSQIGTLSGEPLGYRNRSQFHLKGPRIGYLAAGSHELVPVDSCPISAPLINQALTVLLKSVKDRRWPRFVTEVELFTNGEKTMVNVLQTEGNRRVARGFFDWIGERIHGAADGYLDYATEAGTFRVSHGSFFQVNRFLVDGLVECALRDLSGSSALDLYAGVGLFTLPLAKSFAKVTGVETSASAVRDLAFNAESRGLQVDVQRMQAEQYLEALTESPDVIVADPPRSGLGKGAAKHLVRLKPQRIVIVSCDPSTLARDMGQIVPSGYAVEEFTVADLFPRTHHVECVARLVRT